MKTFRRLSCTTLVLMSIHVFAPVAAAHPLGNFTINHYAGLSASSDAIVIDYVLDMAEIPAFQEISAFDANRNSQPEPDETARYHPAQCEAIRSQLVLRLNGEPVALALVSSGIEFPPGAGGLLTLRLSCAFRATRVVTGENTRVDFEDHSYPTRLGWREIVVTGEGVLLQGDFTSSSLSQRLTAYPQDLLSDPLDQRQVSFAFAPAVAAIQPPAPSAVRGEEPGPLSNARSDAFTQLITLQDLSLPTLLLALVVAVTWGAMHAMTPGHGKTLVGAYLVGSRGTARHALFLGLTTTITHTAGVFALGLVTLFASEFFVPERLYPWLSFLSGVLVVGLGINLFVNRLRPALTGPRAFGGAHLASAAHYEHRHSHAAHHSDAHAPHAHPHDHVPDHGDHVHDHTHSDPDHARAGHSHSHLPPGADGSPVTWRSLLALGISGGLLPCPSALVVLLGAIALGRIGFGLVLVLAFSFGLAGTLTGIGLLLVYAGRLLERVTIRGRVLRLLPAASALFIAAAGMGITAQAFLQLGLMKP
jgi:ABC-type nickel/cobalt efflux system permease component RcnA